MYEVVIQGMTRCLKKVIPKNFVVYKRISTLNKTTY